MNKTTNIVLIFVSLFFILCTYANAKVEVIGSKLYVDGKLYEAKHVGYSGLRIFEFPSEWGICRCNPDILTTPSESRFTCPATPTWNFDIDPQRIEYDLSNIKAMHANGFRTWAEVNDILLDVAAQKDLKIVAGIEVPWGADYSDPAVRQNIIDDKINNYISRYENSPAILFWVIGNETELVIDPTMVPSFFTFVEEFAQAIKAVDSNHPVATVVAYHQDWYRNTIATYDEAVPSLDIWGVNAYPHNSFINPIGKDDYFVDLSSQTDKPIYISEYGVDAVFHTDTNRNFNAIDPNSETIQADINSGLAREIRNEVKRNYSMNIPEAQLIGGSAFEYTDISSHTKGWEDACYQGLDQDHAQKEDMDYIDLEYFGIFASDPTDENPNNLRPRKEYYALQNVWKEPKPVPINYIRMEALPKGR